MRIKRFFSPAQIAKMCDVSTGSVIRWIHEGKLAASVTGGGHHRVQRQDIVQFLKSLRMPIPQDLDPKSASSVKVLIVDDEPEVLQLIWNIFKRYYPKFKIEDARDGFDAGWKIRDLKPDLVILDIKLPGLDGYRVCEFIRSIKTLKETRVIGISGIQEEEARKRIFSAGANDFLQKPFNVVAMKEKIEAQLKHLNHGRVA